MHLISTAYSLLTRLWYRTSELSGPFFWYVAEIAREKWLEALSIDAETGLDPPGYKVRAAQGLDAAVSY